MTGDTGFASIVGSSVSNNEAVLDGGVVYLQGVDKTIQLEGCDVSNNKAQDGGVVYLNDRSVSVAGRRLRAPHVAHGGGGFIDIKRSSLYGNRANKSGGVIFMDNWHRNANLSLDTSIVRDNLALDRGDAFFLKDVGKIYIQNTSLLARTASSLPFDTVYLSGPPGLDCDTYPCAPSEGCTYEKMSLFPCEICGANLVSTKGLTCDLCPNGHTGSPDKKRCLKCVAGKAGIGGVCDPCTEGFVAAEGKSMCEECRAGKYPAKKDKCLDCPVGRAGSGGVCDICSAGKMPNNASTVCVPCADGMHSTDGRSCMPCEQGNSPSLDKAKCVACAEGKFSDTGTICRTCKDVTGDETLLPSVDRSRCECPTNTYNKTYGFIFCLTGSYVREDIEGRYSATTEGRYAALRQKGMCVECDTDCVSCKTQGETLIKPNYGLSARTAAGYSGLQSGPPNEKALYHCSKSTDKCVGEVDPHGDDHTNASSTSKDLQKGPHWLQCPKGHDGPMCMQCADEYVGGTEKPCTLCGTPPTVGEYIMGAFILLLVVGVGKLVQKYIVGSTANEKLQLKLKKAQDAKAKLDKAASMADRFLGHDAEGGTFVNAMDMLRDWAKILVSNVQILVQMPAILKFKFPEGFKEFLGFFGWINLDILGMFSVDCTVKTNLYIKFSTMMLFPIALALLVKLDQFRQLKMRVPGAVGALTAQEIADTAIARTMLVFFLLYPTLSSYCFRMFTCHDVYVLDGEVLESWHVDDYSISCTDDTYTMFKLIGLICVALYPIGIPLAFGLILRTNKKQLSHDDATEMDFDGFAYMVKLLGGKHKFSKKELRKLFDQAARSKDGTDGSDESHKIDKNRKITIGDVARSGINTGLNLINKDKFDEWRKSRIYGGRERLDTMQVFKQKWYQGDKEKFKFITKAFTPKHYWFEMVDYSKKFILSGVLVFCEQGTTSQAFLGLIVTFVYVLISARCMPFKSSKTNVLKIVADTTLFLTLLCTIMLKVDDVGEAIKKRHVDVMLIVVNATGNVVPILIILVITLKEYLLTADATLSDKKGAKKGCKKFTDIFKIFAGAASDAMDATKGAIDGEQAGLEEVEAEDGSDEDVWTPLSALTDNNVMNAVADLEDQVASIVDGDGGTKNSTAEVFLEELSEAESDEEDDLKTEAKSVFGIKGSKSAQKKLDELELEKKILKEKKKQKKINKLVGVVAPAHIPVGVSQEEQAEAIKKFADTW